MSNRFVGKSLEEWENDMLKIKDINDAEEVLNVGTFVGKRYTIKTVNGVIEVLNPCIVCETTSYTSYNTIDDKYLRFVLDISRNDIIDIPKKNILYVRSVDTYKKDPYEFINEVIKKK